jgi:hypothetical protein
MANHNHHSHKHDACSSEDIGETYSLYSHIHTDLLKCLNESDHGSIKKVFKPWDKRLDKTEFVESAVDEELIIFIPFTGVVKLKSFCIIGGEEGSSPSNVKIFTNREDIDFDNVRELCPVKEFELAEDPRGELEYTTTGPKFTNLSNISMYIPSNFGAAKTKIYYIGLKGNFIPVKRGIVVTQYELRPNPAKNNVTEQQPVYRTLGM